MIHALDTNIIVDLLRGRDEKLKEQYLSRNPRDYSVSEMVRAELFFGAKVSSKPVENLQTVQKILSPLWLVPFAGEAIEHYADIRAFLEKEGQPIGPNDLVIAATARANGHTLVTRNTREFLRVPALAVEQW